MANKADSIEGVMTRTASIGDKTPKGFTRKKNVYSCDFGTLALEGEMFGKIPGEKFKVTITPL
jgi:hypothetical protein